MRATLESLLEDPRAGPQEARPNWPASRATALATITWCHQSEPHLSQSKRLPRPQDPPKTDPSARAAFLDAVTRGSTSTWWVESTFARTTGAKTLRSEITEVSRPPDHVVVGVGGATGVLRGHPLSCTPATGGPLCADGTTGGTVTDVAALARLTDAAGGWYALRPAPLPMPTADPARNTPSRTLVQRVELIGAWVAAG